MEEVATDYALFLAKLLTFVLVVGAFALVGIAASRRAGAPGGLTVERLNDRYENLALQLRRATTTSRAFKETAKAVRAARKRRRAGDMGGKRIFVIDFKGDIRATETAQLREEVSAIIGAAAEGDRVLVRLENAGGTVHEHGLAASQLERLRVRGIDLTVCVDKVAASGGYLMAAVANRIIAAPFAILGSIGVVAQLPNFHRWLEARGIDFEQITAGRYKRTLSLFGENTEEGRAKAREEIEAVHALFKRQVGEHRADISLEDVATGEIWFGSQALEMKLVDELGTSDDVLLAAAADDRELLLVKYRAKRPIPERVVHAVRYAIGRLGDAIGQSVLERRLFR